MVFDKLPFNKIIKVLNLISQIIFENALTEKIKITTHLKVEKLGRKMKIKKKKFAKVKYA